MHTIHAPETPGERFFYFLTQLDEYLSLFRQLGEEGVLSPSASSHQLPDKTTLAGLCRELEDCQRCNLSRYRKHLVFGEGNPNADLMFIGEGPAADEDRQGKPFVGASGDLLTKIIQAIGLRREDVYLANIVKCRPPQDRNPQEDEIAQCEPFVRRQIELIQPKIICALGRVATHVLLQTSAPLAGLRGRFHNYQGIKVMPTFHPAHLLQVPHDKRLVWEDMQMIQRDLSN